MRSAALFVVLLASSVSNAADIANRPTLTLDGAKAVTSAALEYAHGKSAPGAAIAVVDASGTLIYLERLDGTFLNASEISVGKARTAVLFGKPTRVFEELVNKGRYAMLDVPAVAPFTPLQGGVPIMVGGKVVGAIGVSGAASAAQDDEIASAGAASFEGTHQAKVSFVPRDQVDAGFGKDANLVSETGFRVNASRRDGPGEAEVHLGDTDIFYVLQGQATVVTGGQVVQPRNLSATEVRGAELRGGEERHIGKGDVITIPRGVPHWFKQVDAPFTYYVVKDAE
ncbi:MAG TPA: heme-binding protein [Steroidobacteraceae bacterium]|nr:heme-binding protein [Steroidobacteraceae bacterium]